MSERQVAVVGSAAHGSSKCVLTAAGDFKPDFEAAIKCMRPATAISTAIRLRVRTARSASNPKVRNTQSVNGQNLRVRDRGRDHHHRHPKRTTKIRGRQTPQPRPAAPTRCPWDTVAIPPSHTAPRHVTITRESAPRIHRTSPDRRQRSGGVSPRRASLRATPTSIAM